MPLPPSTDFTGSTVTEGSFKTAITAMRDWLALMNGTVDYYIKVARGTNASLPSPTEGGWLRWNTDTDVINTTVRNLADTAFIWHKIVTSIIDATWQLRFDFNSASLALFKSTHTGHVAKIMVENDLGDTITVERNGDRTVITSSGTDPIRLVIGSTAVLSVDQSGNVIAAGNITANGTVQ